MGKCCKNMVWWQQHLHRYSTLDANAAAFIAAAGITDATQKSAINTLVVGLKAANLYTKFYALYPIVGGSATSHKFNLINPTDSDAAFRLSFVGGWTHSANGMQPNGINGYADTFFNPLAQSISINSNALHFYSRTNNTTVSYSYGVQSTGLFAALFYTGTATFRSYNMTTGGNLLDTAMARNDGFMTQTRTAVNAQANYRNGASLGSNASASNSKPNDKLVIGARNDGASRSNWDNRQCAFFAISDGFSAAEALTLYTLVQAYQTTLSRNV